MYNLIIIYAFVVITMTLLLVAFATYATFRHHQARPDPDPDRKPRIHVVLISPLWPEWLKNVMSMAVLLVCVVPLSVLAVSLFFGGFTAISEGWVYGVGFEYVLSNVAGLSVALTSVVPTSMLGEVVDVFLSLWAMLLACTFMGIAGGMTLVVRMIEKMPPTVLGFFRYIFIYIPVALLVLSLATGVVIGAIEGWSFVDGFFFMVGSMCGLANPLTSVAPVSPSGMFVEVLCMVGELTLGGAVVSIVGAHPLCEACIRSLEGSSFNMKAAQQAELDVMSEIEALQKAGKVGDVDMDALIQAKMDGNTEEVARLEGLAAMAPPTPTVAAEATATVVPSEAPVQQQLAPVAETLPQTTVETRHVLVQCDELEPEPLQKEPTAMSAPSVERAEQAPSEHVEVPQACEHVEVQQLRAELAGVLTRISEGEASTLAARLRAEASEAAAHEIEARAQRAAELEARVRNSEAQAEAARVEALQAREVVDRVLKQVEEGEALEAATPMGAFSDRPPELQEQYSIREFHQPSTASFSARTPHLFTARQQQQQEQDEESRACGGAFGLLFCTGRNRASRAPISSA